MMPPPFKMTTPASAQWEHGRGLKLCTNPGLVMTTGAIEAIFDFPSTVGPRYKGPQGTN